MNEAQKTLYYIAENMHMQKTISEEGYQHFQRAIELLGLIPENATNIEVFDAVFPGLKGSVYTDRKNCILLDFKRVKEWCNAPYKREGGSK